MKKLRIGVTDCEKTQNYLDWFKHGEQFGYSIDLVVLNYEAEGETFESILNRNRETLKTLDAICFTGGWDIEPSRFGVSMTDADLQKLNVQCTPKRDDMELPLAQDAVNTDLPVFGICRGLQLVNVALGGTLYLDIEQQAGSTNHKALSKTESRYHPLSIQEKNSMLFEFVKAERGEFISSRHHQAADVVGKGLKTTSVSDDGIIEAIEAVDTEKIILLVQWHPERMWIESLEQNKPELNNAFSEKLLEGFLNAVALRKAAKLTINAT
jgi:putative glutamine amidotransferase